MPSGQPDFSQGTASQEVHQVTDLGELAARTGSIVTYHRGGNVFWLDDFEASVLKWATTFGGTGASVALSTVQARSGVQSVLLTAGSDGTRDATIDRTFGRPSGDQVGVEFSIITDSLPDIVRVFIRFFDGTNLLEFRFDIEYGNDRIRLTDSDGSQVVVLSPLNWTGGTFVVHTFKFIVNQNTGSYVRFFYDDIVTDISSRAAPTASSSQERTFQVLIENEGDAGVNDTCYIDDVIITHNEP